MERAECVDVLYTTEIKFEKPIEFISTSSGDAYAIVL
jgi:hypothetical protein